MTKIFRKDILSNQEIGKLIDSIYNSENENFHKERLFLLKLIPALPAMLKVIGDLRDYLEWLDKEEYNRAKNSLERVKYSLNQLDKEHGTEAGG